MDATCNGFQHLALLSLNSPLAKQLNLTSSSFKDDPKDFYSYLANSLKIGFNDAIKSYYEYENRISDFSEFDLDKVNTIISYHLKDKIPCLNDKSFKIDQEMFTKIQETMKEYINSLQRLINLDIKRYIIKQSVMTIPYNVSDHQLVNYIRSNFIRSENGSYFVSSEPLNRIEFSDFTILGKGLRYILNIKFPKLILLLKYLEDLASICVKLQLPIV
jgi:hypothetical protein